MSGDNGTSHGIQGAPEKAAAIARGDAPEEMTPEQKLEHAERQRKAMINHSIKVLAGQGVKALTILSVEEAMEALGGEGVEPQQAAATLDLCAVAHTTDYKALLAPYYERVKAGETALSFLEAREATDDAAKEKAFSADAN